MNTKDKIRVALLLGGDSSEREVSFMSGKAMANALPRERFAVTIFDVASPATRSSQAHTGGDALGKKPRHAYMPVEWNQLTTTLYTGGFDVALPALHGEAQGKVGSRADRRCHPPLDPPLRRATSHPSSGQQPR